MVPSREWTLNLIRERDLPRHIFRHSVMVQRVALTITLGLRANGVPLEARLIDRAALLHDICKMEAIYSGGDHAQLGGELLTRHGFPRVGEVIAQHVRLKELRLDEALIVHYADKRVMHERVVSLDQRFVDLVQRYGLDDTRRQRILGLHASARQMQDLIEGVCGVGLDDLGALNLIASDYPFNGGKGFL